MTSRTRTYVRAATTLDTASLAVAKRQTELRSNPENAAEHARYAASSLRGLAERLDQIADEGES